MAIQPAFRQACAPADSGNAMAALPQNIADIPHAEPKPMRLADKQQARKVATSVSVIAIVFSCVGSSKALYV